MGFEICGHLGGSNVIVQDTTELQYGKWRIKCFWSLARNPHFSAFAALTFLKICLSQVPKLYGTAILDCCITALKSHSHLHHMWPVSVDIIWPITFHRLLHLRLVPRDFLTISIQPALWSDLSMQIKYVEPVNKQHLGRALSIFKHGEVKLAN